MRLLDSQFEAAFALYDQSLPALRENAHAKNSKVIHQLLHSEGQALFGDKGGVVTVYDRVVDNALYKEFLHSLRFYSQAMA